MKYKDSIKVFAVVLLGFSGVLQIQSRPSQKIKIKSVRFDDNQFFSDRQLYRVMISRPSSLFNPSYFHPDLFQDDLSNLELFYYQNGYLEAQIVQYQVTVDTPQQEVHITIQVFEGEQTLVGGLGVFGNEVFSDSLLLSEIKIREGDPFKKNNVEAASLRLLTFYANHGFLDAFTEPNIRINPSTHRALIDFNIKEENRFTINKINLDGLEKTRPQIVRRELSFRSDELVNYSKLLESQRQIYLTGLFKSVFIHPKPPASEDSIKKDILIELKENMSIGINVTAGYGSVEKLRSRGEIYNNNFMGTAQKIGTACKLSFVYRNLEASFTEPWTFGTRWRTDINLSTGYKKEPGFNLNHIGGKLILGRQYLEYFNIMLTYRHERTKLSDIKILEIPRDIKTNIRSFKISFIYDRRDNLFNTKKGIYLEWSNELGGTFTEKINGFLRSIGGLKYFFSWNQSTIIGTSLELGWMEAQGGLSGIPLQERFYTGGPNSLRGFRYQRVGPLDHKGIPVGGRFKLVWNILEVRRTIYKMMGLAIFTDLGNVWSEPEEFNLRNIRFSPGIGLRFDTPIGVARLDLGINMIRREGEPATQLIFSIGQPF